MFGREKGGGGVVPDQARGSEIVTDEAMLFGPFGKDAYPRIVQEVILEKFQTGPHAAENAAERRKFWEKFAEFKVKLALKKGQPLVASIEQIICELNQKIASHFGNRDTNEKGGRTGLAAHLEGVSIAGKDLLLDQNGQTRFPAIVSTRNAHLLAEVVAPIHDIYKYLAPEEAQVAMDHEVMAASLADLFEGMKITIDGQEQSVDAPTASLLAKVQGDHENLFEEKGRTGWIEDQSEIKRMQALFQVIDTLTNVLVPEENGSFSIDLNMLWTRYGNLYFRHLDPVEGKVFRPEWGGYSLQDLEQTFKVLGEQGLSINESQRGSLLEVMKQDQARALQMALDMDEVHCEYNTALVVDPAEKDEIFNGIAVKLSNLQLEGDNPKFVATLHKAISNPIQAQAVDVLSDDQKLQINQALAALSIRR